jgi:hypothetical protein
MTSAVSNDQIVSIYESSEGKLTPEEIVEAFDNSIPLGAVKIALMNGSNLYRQKVKQNKERFTEEDEELAKTVARQLLIAADSDVVKARMVKLVFDERSGRNDKTAKNLNVSVTLISQQYEMAEKAIQAAKEKAIEVDPKHKHLKEINI